LTAPARPSSPPAAATASTPSELASQLTAVAEARGQRLLIVVDPLERVFARDADSEQRKLLLRTLFSSATAPASPIRVLLSLRSDRRGPMEAMPDLRETLARAVMLEPLHGDRLVELLEPRLDAGTRAWLEAAVSEAGATAAALSLVQLAAVVAHGATSEGGARAGDDLREALQRHAQATLDRMSSVEHDLACRQLLRLATAASDDACRHAALVEGLDDAAHDVLDALVRQRLATVDADGALRLSHPSLRSWPTLARLIEAHGEQQAAHEQLRLAAERWDQAGQPSDLLWAPARRRATLAQLADVPLSSSMEAFLSPPVGGGPRATRWPLALGAALLTLLLVGVLWTQLSRPSGDMADAAGSSGVAPPPATGDTRPGAVVAQPPHEQAEVEVRHAEPSARASSTASAQAPPPRQIRRRRPPTVAKPATDPYGSRH
jgi:hypothetical protein